MGTVLAEGAQLRLLKAQRAHADVGRAGGEFLHLLECGRVSFGISPLGRNRLHLKLVASQRFGDIPQRLNANYQHTLCLGLLGATGKEKEKKDGEEETHCSIRN